VVLASPHGQSGRSPQSGEGAREVVWHDLECGRYRADLPLWRELAGSAEAGLADPILEVGAGTGRVTLDLARAGHRVSALELDPELLGALRRRVAGMTVQAFGGDARTFELRHRDFGLCVVPMQTVQLLGGQAGREAFLRRARAHLRPTGLLACAIVTELDPFDCSAGDAGPSQEIARVDATLYISRATRVQVRRHGIRIERERTLVPAGQAVASVHALREHNVVELDRLSAAQLEREGAAAGLTPEPARSVAATEDHVGSVVVILRA
jgi:SAM-dependent methyltransferase